MTASKIILILLVIVGVVLALLGNAQNWNSCHISGTGKNYAIFLSILAFSVLGALGVIINICRLEK